MKITAIITTVLIITGGIIWGLIGLFDFNIVTAIFGGGRVGYIFARIIYSLVGISALWMVFYLTVFKPMGK